MESNNIYVLQHRATNGEVEVECALDQKKKKARIISTTLVRGNVIPFDGIKHALQHYEESCRNTPDETA